MRAYRVEGGPALISGGEVIGIDKSQLDRRATRGGHFQKKGGLHVGSFSETVEFKVGEVIHLPAAPAKSMAERLVPVDGGDDGRARPSLDAKKNGGKGGKRSRKVVAARATEAEPDQAEGGPSADERTDGGDSADQAVDPAPAA